MLVTERGRALLEAVCPVRQNWPLHSPSGLLEEQGGAASCGLYSAPATPLLPREVLPSLLSARSPNPIVSVLELAGSCLAACLRILKSPVQSWPCVSDSVLFPSFFYGLLFLTTFLVLAHLSAAQHIFLPNSFTFSSTLYCKLYSPTFKALVLCPAFYSIISFLHPKVSCLAPCWMGFTVHWMRSDINLSGKYCTSILKKKILGD